MQANYLFHTTIADASGNRRLAVAIRRALEESERLFQTRVLRLAPKSMFRDPSGKGSLRAPVQFGGIVVRHGDLVVGDADGVVIIPIFTIHKSEVSSRWSRLGRVAWRRPLISGGKVSRNACLTAVTPVKPGSEKPVGLQLANA